MCTKATWMMIMKEESEDDDSLNCYVIWNPSIRKSVVIDVPYNTGTVYVGFGFYPNSLDPKIVRILNYLCIQLHVIINGKFGLNFGELSRIPLVLNGFIFWCAEVGNSFENNSTYTIVSFDLASEEFTKIDVPDELACDNFYMFKLRDSLGVVQRKIMESKEVHKVWLMDHVSKSFIELEDFTVTLPEKWKVVGFRDNEQLIIVKIDEQRSELVAYEPYSKQFNNLGFYVDCSYVNSSYTESLLLLNQPDTLNDYEGDAYVTGSELKI
ncbi:putative F-box protein At5g50220 [Rutidosis leptorrhynchoides]|uniref:putative F-box protein At5g50220 n=1 Tax=Rutidosis leptorrhynchoides TaxID=125765 RepID=UPI003A9A3BDC